MEQRMKENQSEADKCELLLWACVRGLIDDATELVNQGVDPSFRDKQGRRAVHYAASKGHTHILQYLGSRGVDLDAEDSTGRAPVHYASTWGHVDTVQFLASKRVWLDATDADDDTALHLACRSLGLCCRGLCAFHPFILILGCLSWPLHGLRVPTTSTDARVSLLNRRGHTEVVLALLDANAKPGLLNKRSLTPYGEALVAEQLSTAQVMAGRAGALHSAGKGFTLLHALAGLGKAVPLGWLLRSAGGSTLVSDASNSEHLTPLHAAAIGGNTVCAELLLQHGADVGACDSGGRTPAQLVTLPMETDPQYKYAIKLHRLLSTTAAATSKLPSSAKGVAGAAAGAQRVVGISQQPQQQAVAANREKRLRQVDVLARLDEGELQHLDAAKRSAVLQVRSVGRMLESYEAMLAVRGDAAFREDASQPEVRAAIEAVRATGSIEPYAGDSRVMSVMGKLRKLQGILRANGGMKVSLDDLLQEVDAVEERKRLAILNASLQASREEAAAALFGREAAQLPGASEQRSQAAAPPKDTSSEGAPPSGSDQGMLMTVGSDLLVHFMQASLVAVVLLLVLWVTNRLPWQQAGWMEQHLPEHTPAPSQPAQQMPTSTTRQGPSMEL